ncbi:MAG TPA: PfkB family carbohydrate kinase [Micromonosporaceae bacterium]|jgi:fructose-1-phosphate kinase PfkB-like protein
MILAVTLSPSVDQTYVLDTLVPAADHRPRETLRLAGGNGLNFARAAHALGADVVAIGIVGGASGRWMVTSLEAEGLPFVPIVGRATTRTRMSLADTGAGALTEVYEEPSPVDGGEWDVLEEVLTTTIVEQAPSWLVVSGLVPPGAPDDAVARLLAIGAESGAHIAVDTAAEGLRQALAAGTADLVTINVTHAAALLGDDGEKDLSLLGTGLRAMSASDDTAIVVIAGQGGAWASFPGSEPVSLEPTDPGAYPHGRGDAFLAGLVSALDRGDVPQEALRVAVEASAANARIPGAGRLDLAGS